MVCPFGVAGAAPSVETACTSVRLALAELTPSIGAGFAFPTIVAPEGMDAAPSAVEDASVDEEAKDTP